MVSNEVWPFSKKYYILLILIENEVTEYLYFG